MKNTATDLKEGQHIYSIKGERFSLDDFEHLSNELLEKKTDNEQFVFFTHKLFMQIKTVFKDNGVAKKLYNMVIINNIDLGATDMIRYGKFSFFLIPREVLDHPTLFESGYSWKEMICVARANIREFVKKLIEYEDVINGKY